MRILAIDCGIKNLAWCLYDSSEGHIVDWEVADVTDVGTKDTPVPEKLVMYLQTKPGMLECDVVLIEKQPPRNAKMRIVEAVLHTYFVIKGKLATAAEHHIGEVISYSAKHKLAGVIGIQGKTNYGARKKAAIAKVIELLPEGRWRSFFCSQKKKDDSADCFLMTIAYTKQLEAPAVVDGEITKRVLAKKPRDGCEVCDYTNGNIKFEVREWLKTKTSEELQAVMDDPADCKAVFWQEVKRRFGTISSLRNTLRI